nr:hypothetical protein [Tanacetum cinerariifolium]
YVAESDPEEDPEEDPKKYEDDEIEDGPVDYPMDRGDDDDSDSSGDDVDDEDEDEEDYEEGEEHLAPVDSAVVIPTVELVSLPEGTERVIPPPSTDTTTTGARITVRLQAAISLPPEAEVEILLAMPTPPLSPLTSLSPPAAGERLARMASTQVLIDAVTAALPSPPLPPPLYIPSPVDRRDDIPETEIPPRKRSCLFALGFRDTWVDLEKAVPEIVPMTLGEVNTRVTELAELHEHHTQDLYALLEDAQDSIYTRVSAPCTSDTATVAGYSYSDTAPDMRREMGDMQAELLALREHPRRARQPGSDAIVPDHQDAPRDANSHISGFMLLYFARPLFRHVNYQGFSPLA